MLSLTDSDLSNFPPVGLLGEETLNVWWHILESKCGQRKAFSFCYVTTHLI